MHLDHFSTLVDEAMAAQGLAMTRLDPDDQLSGTVEPGVTVNLTSTYRACANVPESEARDEIEKLYQVSLIKTHLNAILGSLA